MPAQSYSRSIFRLASVLLIVLTAKVTGFAQHPQLLVTFDGPWSYAADPRDSNRVVIIAPHPDHHLDAHIHPKPDSADPFLPMGQYKLDIGNPAGSCDETKPQGSEVPANLFPLKQFTTIDPGTIKSVIEKKKGGARYAISLPKPCYYSTEDTAYSIISANPIKTPAVDGEGTAFTTKMVLHYFVTTVTPATLSLTPDVGTASTSPVPFKNNKIEIEIRADMLPGNDDCDTMSADAFGKEIGLFTSTQNFYLWFPDMDENGYQVGNDATSYSVGCENEMLFAATVSGSDRKLAAKIRAEIKEVEAYFRRQNPSESERRATRHKLEDIEKSINAFPANKLSQGPFNKRALMEANQELEIAKKQIENKDAQKEKAFNGRLPQTAQYNSYFTTGSADCHGAQTGIDGTIP
jgi:hypothetical protein